MTLERERGKKRKSFDELVEEILPILNRWECPWKREAYQGPWTKDHVRGAMDLLFFIEKRIRP